VAWDRSPAGPAGPALDETQPREDVRWVSSHHLQPTWAHKAQITALRAHFNPACGALDHLARHALAPRTCR
jgi:hypothetical protein